MSLAEKPAVGYSPAETPSAPLAAPLDQVLNSVETARGLPNAHYTDAQTFGQEKKALFFNNWAAIGFAKDIPETGDARPVELLGMPLLMVRDKDGAVKVYQNTCRHRGMILVSEPTKVKGVIRCPYHSWCYGLDGALRSTPHVGGPGVNEHEGIKPDELGLCDIRSYVWRDVVFVNVSGEAPAFEEYAAQVMTRWKDHEQPLYHGGPDSSFKLTVKGNWKLAVENYCESYHLPWVHPGLNSYSRLEDHYHIEEPGCYSGQGTLVYKQLIGDDEKRFPDFKDLPAKWDEAAEYIAFYPNVLFGVHRDHSYAILLEAVDETTTVEHVEIYYASPELQSEQWSEQRSANSGLWQAVFEEDVFVVEGMQKGRHGEKFDGGKFSPAMDGPTHCFHHWAASQMLRLAEDSKQP
ncbi:aromatic ring-hydroxylating oxygenase subunit alpha [Rhodovibrionaceae bacterium A322]